MKLLLVIATILLFGCASKPITTPADTMKAGMADAVIEQAKVPLFKLTCPPTGCVISSLEVGNPNSAAILADAVKGAFVSQPSDGVLFWRDTMDMVKTLGPWGIGAWAVGKVVDRAPTTSTNTSISANTTNTNTVGGNGVIGSGTFSAPITSTSLVNSGNPITNSYNPVNPVPIVPRVCTVVAGVLTCSP